MFSTPAARPRTSLDDIVGLLGQRDRGAGVAMLSRLGHLGRTATVGPRGQLDRGFDNNAIIGYLNEHPIPIIMAFTIRGKQGGTRALLKGRKNHVTTYTRRSTQYSTETFTVHVACKYGKGRYKRRGLYRLCLHCHWRVEDATAASLS